MKQYAKALAGMVTPALGIIAWLVAHNVLSGSVANDVQVVIAAVTPFLTALHVFAVPNSTTPAAAPPAA